MKVFTNIMKVLAALAAVAGVVYLLATYGDKLVRWAKGLCHRHDCYFTDACDYEEDYDCQETPAEAAAPAAPAAEGDHAEESDFEN